MNKIPTWLFWLIAAITYLCGEVYSKKLALEFSYTVGIAAFIFYALSSICWIGIIRNTNQLTIYSTLWELGCILGAAIIGVICFGEQLSPIQWLGFVLAIVAGILLLL